MFVLTYSVLHRLQQLTPSSNVWITVHDTHDVDIKNGVKVYSVVGESVSQRITNSLVSFSNALSLTENIPNCLSGKEIFIRKLFPTLKLQSSYVPLKECSSYYYITRLYLAVFAFCIITSSLYLSPSFYNNNHFGACYSRRLLFKNFLIKNSPT